MLVKIGGVLGLLGPHRCVHRNQEVEKPLGTYSEPQGSLWDHFIVIFCFQNQGRPIGTLRGEPTGALGGPLWVLKVIFSGFKGGKGPLGVLRGWALRSLKGWALRGFKGWALGALRDGP